MEQNHKICTRCKKDKPLAEFHFDKKGKFGRHSSCKVCAKHRRRTERAVIMHIFAHQKDASIRKGYSLPSYSREELTEWLYENDFKLLYENWVQSDYNKDLYPSVDRINNYKSYNINNIQLITFKENHSNFADDIRNARNKGEQRCKEVHRYSLSGDYIDSFHSIMEANRQTGIYHISCASSGKRPHAGGFKWSFTKRAGYNVLSKQVNIKDSYIAEYSLVV